MANHIPLKSQFPPPLSRFPVGERGDARFAHRYNMEYGRANQSLAYLRGAKQLDLAFKDPRFGNCT